MSTPAEMAERHGAVLAELAELGLTLARGLHEKALSAETPEAACELGLAFHRISRSVRQSLALEARLARERLRPAPAAPPQTLDAPAPAARERLDQPQGREAPPRAPIARLGVGRLGWDEAERAEALETEDLFGDLADDLSAALRDDAPSPPAAIRAGRRRTDPGHVAAPSPRELALAGAHWPPPVPPRPPPQAWGSARAGPS